MMEINYELRLKRSRAAEEWAGDDKKKEHTKKEKEVEEEKDQV